MHLHDLPLAMFQAEHVGCSRFQGRAFPGDGLFDGRPAHRPFLPRLDLLGSDRERTDFLQLPRPDLACLAPMPPLGCIRSRNERARLFRQPGESRLVVPLRDRPGKSSDDAPDFLGRLHSRSVLDQLRERNRTCWRPGAVKRRARPPLVRASSTPQSAPARHCSSPTPRSRSPADPRCGLGEWRDRELIRIRRGRVRS